MRASLLLRVREDYTSPCAVAGSALDGQTTNETATLQTDFVVEAVMNAAIQARHGGFFGGGAQRTALVGKEIAQHFRSRARKAGVAGCICRKIGPSDRRRDGGIGLVGAQQIIGVFGVPAANAGVHLRHVHQRHNARRTQLVQVARRDEVAGDLVPVAGRRGGSRPVGPELGDAKLFGRAVVANEAHFGSAARNSAEL